MAGQIDSEDEMGEFCRKVGEFLTDFNQKTDRPYTLSASIGTVCGIPEQSVAIGEFIKAADEKMYVEKVRYHKSS